MTRKLQWTGTPWGNQEEHTKIKEHAATWVLVPRKEYARSRHQCLFEKNVRKTGKDVVYEF